MHITVIDHVDAFTEDERGWEEEEETISLIDY